MLLIWERKLGTALETRSVLGGLGGTRFSSGYRTALPRGWLPRGWLPQLGTREGSPCLGLWSCAPIAVTRLPSLTLKLGDTSPAPHVACEGDMLLL